VRHQIVPSYPANGKTGGGLPVFLRRLSIAPLMTSLTPLVAERRRRLEQFTRGHLLERANSVALNSPKVGWCRLTLSIPH
jgi:hypothetical protein